MEEVIGAIAGGRSRGSGWQESEQERVWLHASQKGDQLAFNRLILRWEQPVYNLVLRMLGNREEAADTTQEIFLSVYRAIGRFKGNSKFSTWLYRVAMNHCLSKLRRKPLTAVSLDEPPAGGQAAPELPTQAVQESQVLQQERRSAILKSLKLLPSEQRAVIELKLFQDETFEVIAEILDTPLSTVKSRFYAGVDQMKARLEVFLEDRDV